MKRILKAACLMLAAITVLLSAACGDSYQDAIIYFEIPEKPYTVDPQTASADSELAIVANIFEGLLRKNESGAIVGGASKSFEYNNLTYTFKLREYKRPGEDVRIEHVSQLCDYADLLQLKYGIPKSQMQLQLLGTSIDDDTAQMLELKKSYGHNITFVPYMRQAEE